MHSFLKNVPEVVLRYRHLKGGGGGTNFCVTKCILAFLPRPTQKYMDFTASSCNGESI